MSTKKSTWWKGLQGEKAICLFLLWWLWQEPAFPAFLARWWFWHLLLLLHIFRNILWASGHFSILNILLQCTEHYNLFRNILWASGETEDADVLQEPAAPLNMTDMKLLHLNRVKCTKYNESLLGKGVLRCTVGLGFKQTLPLFRVYSGNM